MWTQRLRRINGLAVEERGFKKKQKKTRCLTPRFDVPAEGSGDELQDSFNAWLSVTPHRTPPPGTVTHAAGLFQAGTGLFYIALDSVKGWDGAALLLLTG